MKITRTGMILIICSWLLSALMFIWPSLECNNSESHQTYQEWAFSLPEPYVEPGKIITEQDGIIKEIIRYNTSVSIPREISHTCGPNHLLDRDDTLHVFIKVKYTNPATHEAEVIYMEHIIFSKILEDKKYQKYHDNIQVFMHVVGIPRWYFYTFKATRQYENSL